jgi:hypothetical protein
MFIIQPGQGVGSPGQALALGLAIPRIAAVVADSWKKLLQFTLEINQGIAYSLGIRQGIDCDLAINQGVDSDLKISQGIGYSLARWYTWRDDQIL